MCEDRSLMISAKAFGIAFGSVRARYALRMLELGNRLEDKDKEILRNTATIFDEVDTVSFAPERISLEEAWRRRGELEIDSEDAPVLEAIGKRIRRFAESEPFVIDLPACVAELRDLANGRPLAIDARVPFNRLRALCRIASDVGEEFCHPPGCF